MSEYTLLLNCFEGISKASGIPLIKNIHSEYSQNVYLELLENHIFHPVQYTNEWENEANRLCFPLILWPSAKVKTTESGIQW